MLFARYHCPQCGTIFRHLGAFVTSTSTKKCPKCGFMNAPLHEDDKKYIEREEKSSCEFG